MKAAAYLRVSKDDGSQTSANQEPEVLRVCSARNWEPVFFREQESSVKYRPQWEAVKNAVHRGEVGAVVVWALDRAGRNRVQLAHDLAEMSRKGATVVSVREPWIDQPVGPMRDLLIQLMGWFAQTERDRLIERTKAGRARAAAEGKICNRPPLDGAIVERIRAAYDRGVSPFVAAPIIDVAESTIRTYFKRWKTGFNTYPRQVGKKYEVSGAMISALDRVAKVTRDK